MIDWLVQTTTDLPVLPAEAWLSPPERERLSNLRIEKRRREWLLGRWTAKRLVQTHLARMGLGQVDLAEIAVTPAADGTPELGAADPALRSALRALCLTISHSDERAFCALGPGGAAVGADIELIAVRSPAFAADFFTPGELALVASAPPALHETLVTAVWSTKEAVLKALRRGLTVDTRLVECLPALPAAGRAPEAWTPVPVRCHPSLGSPAASVSCWWQVDGQFVLTVAALGAPQMFA